MSLAEKGGQEGVSDAAGTSEDAAGAASGAVAPEHVEVESHMYENTAFQREQDVSPDQPSHTSSERALSAYAETASMSVGDVEQDVSVSLLLYSVCPFHLEVYMYMCHRSYHLSIIQKHKTSLNMCTVTSTPFTLPSKNMFIITRKSNFSY